MTAPITCIIAPPMPQLQDVFATGPEPLGYESIQNGIDGTVCVHEQECDRGEKLIARAADVIATYIVLKNPSQMVREITDSE